MTHSFRTLFCTLFFILFFGQTGSAAPLLTILYTANSWGHSAPLRA